jgi:hydroxyethylthiazole kinase-like uncharacterized protein yjeF
MNYNNLPKLLSTQDIREADAYTIKKGISSIDLMEKAAQAFIEKLLTLYAPENVLILAGMGNNGGDAAAAARLLDNQGVVNQLYLVCFKENPSPDCRVNLKKLGSYREIRNQKDFPNLNNYDLIIDGVFGSGLEGSVQGLPKAIIDFVNECEVPVISIDIPSGVPGDGIVQGSAIRADHTISFQVPKKAFFFPENADYIPKWHVVDIELDKEFLKSRPSNSYLFSDTIGKELPKRKRQSHKGTYGHALVLAGSKGKMGAAVLATRAGLHSGAGLVTAGIPKVGLSILQTAVPEVMCRVFGETELEYDQPNADLKAYTAIAIGPGIGTKGQTQQFLGHILEKVQNALVLDADALNLLSLKKDWIQKLPKGSILTPHIKEFDRLMGTSSNSIVRYDKASTLSSRQEVVVVLKDAYTRVFAPDGRVYLNTFGNAGMATAGAGDVLTGIITGLKAQGLPSIDAALLGVYFHAKAGDAAQTQYGTYGLTAGRILEALRLD